MLVFFSSSPPATGGTAPTLVVKYHNGTTWITLTATPKYFDGSVWKPLSKVPTRY